MIEGLPGLILNPSSNIKKKINKTHSEKIPYIRSKKCFLYFGKYNLFLFSQKKTFFLCFRKLNFRVPRLKKFRKELSDLKKINKDHYEKISYISGNETSGESLQSPKNTKKILVVRKMELSGPKLKKICYYLFWKSLSYISGNGTF